MKVKSILVIACIGACLSVVMGAFGAHALKEVLSANALAVFNTAVKYQMWHSSALLFVGLISVRFPLSFFYWAAALFITGIVLFSGSLYLLALGGPSWLGPITPIGGLSFIIAWLLLIFGVLKIEI